MARGVEAGRRRAVAWFRSAVPGNVAIFLMVAKPGA